MIILAASLFGVQLGAIGTTYVKDYTVKSVMASIMLIVLVLQNRKPVRAWLEPGDEVAQLYVHEVKPVVKRPAKELRGFQRVTLAPGEKRTLTFTVPAEKLAYWDESTHAFVVNPGPFDILVGASSDDIRETARVTVAR